jgi:hypothetical protein
VGKGNSVIPITEKVFSSEAVSLLYREIESNASKNFRILLRDPIFHYSELIREPNKLAEGFNRTKTASLMKKGKMDAHVLNVSSLKGKLRKLKTPQSVKPNKKS